MVQITELFGNKKQFKIINHFIDNPSCEISQTDLWKKLKFSKTTLVKHLDFLSRESILRLKRIGTSNLYSLNKENEIVKHLKILNNLLLLQKMKKITANIEVYLFGSAARGEDAESSDFDLLVIGKINKDEMIHLIDKLKISKTISLQIFTQQEYSSMMKKDPAFYERLEKDKIRVA